MLNLLRLKGRKAGLMTLLLVFFIFLIAGLNSCGSGTEQSAGGGIGGTGKYAGVISDFGSVFVNNIEFDTSNTSIISDDDMVTEEALRIGMKVQLEAAGYSALSIVFEPDVKGPVDSIDPVNGLLVVLGQNIVVSGTTVFDGINSLNDLKAGDNIELSGFFDSGGDILATFIGLEAPGLQEFKVQGTVSNHDPVNKTFSINSLSVDYSQVQNPPAIDTGSFVRIKGALQGNTFMANSLVQPLPFASPGDELEIEGVITHVTSLSDFEVNGLRVQTNAQTDFENGTASDIAVDILVEVEGKIDSRGILIADEVEFLSFINGDSD